MWMNGIRIVLIIITETTINVKYSTLTNENTNSIIDLIITKQNYNAPADIVSDIFGNPNSFTI